MKSRCEQNRPVRRTKSRNTSSDSYVRIFAPHVRAPRRTGTSSAPATFSSRSGLASRTRGFSRACCLSVTECLPFTGAPSRTHRCYSLDVRIMSVLFFFSVETDKQEHACVKAAGVREARRGLELEVAELRGSRQCAHEPLRFLPL